MEPASFKESCTLCPRLAEFLCDVREKYPDYHAKPVSPFGADHPELLVVGLAPGLHGANATGRPFTGDYAGILLYETLHRFGFSNAPVSTHRSDKLRLRRCRITNAVKCVPPQNKPTPAEIQTCNGYLQSELSALPAGIVVLALGAIAHGAVLRACGLKPGAYPFGHGNIHSLPSGQVLIDSYHCSRYNTQTRRLTEEMFHDIFRLIEQHLPRGKS